MRDILVHLDGDANRQVRLSLALTLAERFKARLTGLFAQSETDAPSLVARRSSDHLSGVALEVEADFRARCHARGVEGRWWQLAHGEYGYVISETVFCSRFVDLVVMGQGEKRGGAVPHDLVTQVLRNCGRPLLVVPRVGQFSDIDKRVVVAWNADREATRALHDALPFLKAAEEVTLLSARAPEVSTSSQPGPKANIVDHLATHGIAARWEVVPAIDIDVVDLLLSRSFDLGADMLVMGGLRQAGLAARLRNSVTRHVLENMTLPVLLSH